MMGIDRSADVDADGSAHGFDVERELQAFDNGGGAFSSNCASPSALKNTTNSSPP